MKISKASSVLLLDSAVARVRSLGAKMVWPGKGGGKGVWPG